MKRVPDLLMTYWPINLLTKWCYLCNVVKQLLAITDLFTSCLWKRWHYHHHNLFVFCVNCALDLFSWWSHLRLCCQVSIGCCRSTRLFSKASSSLLRHNYICCQLRIGSFLACDVIAHGWYSVFNLCLPHFIRNKKAEDFEV